MSNEYDEYYRRFKIGVVVRHKDPIGRYSKFTNEKLPLLQGELGHVVGFAMVEYDKCIETIIKVQWMDGEITPIHPSNVEII